MPLISRHRCFVARLIHVLAKSTKLSVDVVPKSPDDRYEQNEKNCGGGDEENSNTEEERIHHLPSCRDHQLALTLAEPLVTSKSRYGYDDPIPEMIVQ